VHGPRTVCSGFIGHDDGGPSRLELIFNLDPAGGWRLDAVVRTTPGRASRDYVDKRLRRARSCPPPR
jgi:hypothetical protein